jgi:hypothetical protein
VAGAGPQHNLANIPYKLRRLHVPVSARWASERDAGCPACCLVLPCLLPSAAGYGAGGLLSVDLGSYPRAKAFMEAVQNEQRFGLLAVSLGYFDTLVSASASSTASGMKEEALAKAGEDLPSQAPTQARCPLQFLIAWEVDCSRGMPVQHIAIIRKSIRGLLHCTSCLLFQPACLLNMCWYCCIITPSEAGASGGVACVKMHASLARSGQGAGTSRQAMQFPWLYLMCP